MLLAQYTIQNSSDNLPSYLQPNIIAQMLSIREEWQLKTEKNVQISTATQTNTLLWLNHIKATRKFSVIFAGC